MQKVWILGDSYAAAYKGCGYDYDTWPILMLKKYDVSNYAVGGSGPDYTLGKLHELLHKYDIEYIKNVVLIVYLSSSSRINFSFLKQSNDASFLLSYSTNTLSDLSKNPKTSYFDTNYKNYRSFIKYFFKFYYFFNERFIFMSYLGQYTLLKEMSKLFKKILVIPVYECPILLNKQFTIDNTEKFTIGKGIPIRYHDKTGIDFDKPNHMREENHRIVYNMTVDWIENNISFDTEKLIKPS